MRGTVLGNEAGVIAFGAGEALFICAIPLPVAIVEITFWTGPRIQHCKVKVITWYYRLDQFFRPAFTESVKNIHTWGFHCSRLIAVCNHIGEKECVSKHNNWAKNTHSLIFGMWVGMGMDF